MATSQKESINTDLTPMEVEDGKYSLLKLSFGSERFMWTSLWNFPLTYVPCR